MRPALLGCCVATLTCPGFAQRAFVEVSAARSSYFAGEPVVVRMRFGVEAVFARKNLLQRGTSSLDLPVDIEAPWAEKLDVVEARGPKLTFALNHEAATAGRIDRKRHVAGAVTWRLLPAKAGRLVLAAPLLRIDYATEFVEQLFGPPRPKNKKEATVRGEPLALEIRPLPEAGRPRAFSGAVGSFEVRATATPRTLAAGDTLAVTLRIEGTGNLRNVELPALAGLPGFHLLGRIDRDRAATRLEVTYHLTPLHASVRALPRIGFAYFEPRPQPRYRTAWTDPIRLDVRPAAGVKPNPRAEAAPATVPGRNEIFGIKPLAPHEPRGALSVVGLVAGLLGPWLLAGGFVALRWTVVRRRRQTAARAARRAYARFRAAADQARAVTDYLTARLDCPEAAVVDPRLESRLVAAGIPHDLAARTTQLVAVSVTNRFAKPGQRVPHEDPNLVVAALEEAFVDVEVNR